MVKIKEGIVMTASNWRTRENVVKSFVARANTKGMTHEELGKRYQEMVSSNYSY